MNIQKVYEKITRKDKSDFLSGGNTPFIGDFTGLRRRRGTGKVLTGQNMV